MKNIVYVDMKLECKLILKYFYQVNNFIFIYSVFQTNKLCPICNERVRRRHLRSLYFAGPGVD